MDLPIIFQNEFFVVVDKPAGVLSVPGRKGGTAEGPDLARILGERTGERIWPVHRLDQAVSGILLYAKQQESHRAANAWFEKHLMGKCYEALTEGPAPHGVKLERCRSRGGDGPNAAAGATCLVEAQEDAETVRWETRILRGKKRAYESPAGKPAITEARWLGTVGLRDLAPNLQELPLQGAESRDNATSQGAEVPGKASPRGVAGRSEASGTCE